MNTNNVRPYKYQKQNQKIFFEYQVMTSLNLKFGDFLVSF